MRKIKQEMNMIWHNHHVHALGIVSLKTIIHVHDHLTSRTQHHLVSYDITEKTSSPLCHYGDEVNALC